MPDKLSAEAKLARLRALRTTMVPGGLDGIERAQRIDVTYSSNALEGNTLTAGETASVIEHGLTVGGKPLRDHLEAIDHDRALEWVGEVAQDASRPLAEADIRQLHGLVVAGSAPGIAGRYAMGRRYVNTDAGAFVFPPPASVPGLMGDLARWLTDAPAGAAGAPRTAFEAHRRLVAIHPFDDGNGRTARLLMNLVLMRAGYPPVSVRPEHRPVYLAALERDQATGDAEPFHALMHERLDATLELYLDAARHAQPRPSAAPPPSGLRM